MVREQVQPPCMEDCEHEDEDGEFSLGEEDDYPSSCVEEYTDHLRDEDI